MATDEPMAEAEAVHVRDVRRPGDSARPDPRRPAQREDVPAMPRGRRAVADEHIRALVDAAPPLTAEQRARLAALLPGPQAPAARSSAPSSRAAGLTPARRAS